MNSIKIFGTDGVRGVANKYPITAELAMKLAIVVGHKFKGTRGTSRVVIGKDTRLSGYLLEPALTAGFISVGVDVILVGPVPSSGVSNLTKSLRCNLGVMLSASHNSFEDNGIKLFTSNGLKLSDDMEEEIETLLSGTTDKFRVSSDELGRAERLDDGTGVVRYIEFVKNSFPNNISLSGLKIVLDCSNGAAYKVAPRIFNELGASIIPIGVSPDGKNINSKCGSQYPEKMMELVKQEHADFGIALDGDADRIICCDEKGNKIDGDQILAVIANRLKRKGLLNGKKIVATTMSNTGLENYLKGLGLDLVRTQVGDRYVAQKMLELDSNLGGEQSGHIILGSYSYTGDGVLVALQLLAEIVEQDSCASIVLNKFNSTPQVIKNVSVSGKQDFIKAMESKSIKKIINNAENTLDGKGRVNVRMSGTEPLIRIMVEGDSDIEINSIANQIERAIEDNRF